MANQSIIEIEEDLSKADSAPEKLADNLANFAQNSHKFGSVFLESSLFAYNRGKQSFAATDPIDSWAIEPNQRIPSNWKSSLDSFLSDSKAFYALFFSYEFGAELVTGHQVPKLEKLETNNEYKVLALKYDNVQILHNSQNIPLPNTPIESAKLLTQPNREIYFKNLSKIKKHIHEGDIYQANLTAEWQIASKAKPWDVYRRLQSLNPCQYGGFANLGSYSVISSSPERLVSVENSKITANPIKGTIAVGQTQEQTQQNLQHLLNSEKDRAELLMIVDLLRNDLGKICKTGTVKTPELWRPETYSSLIHLVAEISGELSSDTTPSQIIEATFPGGSITGAPKRRAIKILRQIENRNRGIYTGSFGYKHGANLDLNIAIRTMKYTPANKVYHAQAGGGIVADSNPQAEFDEASLKVLNLLKAIDPQLKP